MAHKGQFKKGGGRIGDSRKHHSRKRKSHAMTHTPRTHTVYKTRKVTVVKHRRGKGGGGLKLSHLAIAAAGLGYLTSDKHGPAVVREYGSKIPGAATFGVPAAIGVAALVVDKYVKANRWLKLVGYAGIVLAAVKLGDQGTDFKFVGEGDQHFDVGDED